MFFSAVTGSRPCVATVRVHKPMILDPEVPFPPFHSVTPALLCSYLHTNLETAVVVWRPCLPTSRPVPVAAGRQASPETRASLRGGSAFAEATPRGMSSVCGGSDRDADGLRWSRWSCVLAVSRVGPLLGNKVAGIGGGERIWLVAR